MNKISLFKNTGLYNIAMSNNGRDIILYFTDTIIGKNYGYIICKDILSFSLNINNFIDYSDNEDSLFPIFIPEVILNQNDSYKEITIDVGVFIRITSNKILIQENDEKK